MPWIGPAIMAGGGLLQGAFGGASDPGPSGVLQNSRKDVLGQSDRWFDTIYGDQWRNSLYGDPGINEQIDQGSGLGRAKFRYGQGADGSAGTGGSRFGGNTPFGTKPILAQLYDLQNQGIQADSQALGQYGGNITRLGESGYRQAQKYGTGQSKVINDSSDKALKDANALTLARANASGLGGATSTNDLLGGNAAAVNRGRNAALADVQDRATGMRVNQRNVQAGQQQAVGGLYNTFAERANQLRAAPINLQMQAIGSPVGNPFSVSGGQAPTGANNQPLANLGNIASQFGGILTAQSLYPQLAGNGTPQGGGGSGGSYLGWGQYR